MKILARVLPFFIVCLAITACRADVHEVTSSIEFDQIITSEPRVVVEFTSSSAVHDRYGQIFEKVSGLPEFSGYKFLMVDVGKHRGIAMRHSGVSSVSMLSSSLSIPTTKFFKNGHEISELQGAVGEATLKSEISKMLGK